MYQSDCESNPDNFDGLKKRNHNHDWSFFLKNKRQYKIKGTKDYESMCILRRRTRITPHNFQSQTFWSAYGFIPYLLNCNCLRSATTTAQFKSHRNLQTIRCGWMSIHLDIQFDIHYLTEHDWITLINIRGLKQIYKSILWVEILHGVGKSTLTSRKWFISKYNLRFCDHLNPFPSWFKRWFASAVTRPGSVTLEVFEKPTKTQMIFVRKEIISCSIHGVLVQI